MKGILFKPDMRQAIIELRKTQTRRLEASLARVNEQPDLWECQEAVRDVPPIVRKGDWLFNQKDEQWKCIRVRPRYSANETVYLKSGQWATAEQYDSLAPKDIPEHAPIWYGYTLTDIPHTTYKARGRWRSPMFLRECHARDFITFVSVIPQRLWDITQDDALAESVTRNMASQLGLSVPVSEEEFNLTAARRTYEALWDSINAKRGHPWSKNEWVFSYTFKLVPRPETY